MEIKRLAVSVILIFLAGACSLAGDPLDGTKWQLAMVNRNASIVGSVVTLEFADQRLSGSSGCNAYGAEYRVNGSNFEVGAIAATLMACESQEVMDQEASFLTALQRATSFEINESNLILYDEAGNSLLELIETE